jgi:hypothetical protein
MRTNKTIYMASALLMISAFTFFSCNKDDSTTPDNQITTSVTNEVQMSESHDAIAETIESDVDNNLDNLEANNYTSTTLKSGEASCITVKIDSSATLWPRTVTLTYNCTQTINDENISRTGEIVIVVNRTKTDDSKYVNRTITFNNFKLSTDSSSVVVNGTRTMTRLKVKTLLSTDKKNYTVSMTDTITSNLTFNISYKNGTTIDTTITFTRVTNKTRTVTKNFKREGLFIWKSDNANDSITYTGKISGKDFKGNSYVRKCVNPIKITRCATGQMVISSGSIELSSNNAVTGTVTYEKEGCSNKINLSKDGKVKKIERKMSKKLMKG